MSRGRRRHPGHLGRGDKPVDQLGGPEGSLEGVEAVDAVAGGVARGRAQRCLGNLQGAGSPREGLLWGFRGRSRRAEDLAGRGFVEPGWKRIGFLKFLEFFLSFFFRKRDSELFSSFLCFSFFLSTPFFFQTIDFTFLTHPGTATPTRRRPAALPRGPC